MMDIISLLFEPTTWTIFAVTAMYTLYRRGTSTFNHFSDQGIPGPKPIAFIGSIWGMWKQNLPLHDIELAEKYGKVYGTFEGTLPNLYVNDTKLIKSIFVKDFDHFINRRNFDVSEVKFLRKMVSLMENQEWKDVRSALTPSFTTGKIKRYSVQMKECADQLSEKLISVAETDGKISLKDELSIVTMSVIAKCAFGITIENLGDKNNSFMNNAKKAFQAPINKSPLILLLFVLPKVLLKHISKMLFKNDAMDYFFDVMEKLVKERAKSIQKFHDFPETSSEAFAGYTKEENGKTVPMWNKDDVEELVTAQATIFLLAGFDTTANTLSASCFILARNPDLQEKMYDLIMSKIDQFGDVSHEMIQEMPYVDHFINEVLRMYAPIARVERASNKDVTYDGIHIKKGTMVTVSAYAIHYSEEYYPNAKTFNPDRWNAENKANLDPYAFMPFGMGPRNCIGMRFALEEVKLILCTLIKQFRFFSVEETPTELTFEDGFNGLVVPIKTTVGIALRT